MDEDVMMKYQNLPKTSICLVCSKELMTKNKKRVINCVVCKRTAHIKCLITNKSVKASLKDLKDPVNSWVVYQCFDCKVIMSKRNDKLPETSDEDLSELITTKSVLTRENKQYESQLNQQINEINLLKEQIITRGNTRKKSINKDELTLEVLSNLPEESFKNLSYTDSKGKSSTEFVNDYLPRVQAYSPRIKLEDEFHCLETEFGEFKRFIADRLDEFNKKFLSIGIVIQNQGIHEVVEPFTKVNENVLQGNTSGNSVVSQTKPTLAEIVKKSNPMPTNRNITEIVKKFNPMPTNRKEFKVKLDETINQISMAEIIDSRVVKNSQIRNVKIITKDEKKIEILNNILSNQELSNNVKIIKISNKSNTNRVIFCETNAEALKLDKLLVSRLSDYIKSSLPINKLRVKLINAIRGNIDTDTFMNMLCMQNELNVNSLRVIESYKITRGKFTYTNLIVEVDNLITFKELIQKGSLSFGLNSIKVFEIIELNQCKKCLKYGHFAQNCRYNEFCRWCGGNHAASVCVNKASNPKCINCLHLNKKSDLSSYVGYDHVATYDLCPVRLKRVMELKKFLSKS